MLPKSLEYRSPNFNERPENTKIDTIVIHYTEKEDDVTWHLEALELKVSAHYLINREGKVFSVVPDHLRAFHAGKSFWRGREKVNDFSIGIELDNNGKENFSDALMDSLISLCKELIYKHPIDPFNIIGHSDVAPGRKSDPGRLFDWDLLAKNGIGVMPKNLVPTTVIPNIEAIQMMFSEYGYKIEVNGVLDQSTLDVMKAFNEHFNQRCLENWDIKSQMMLESLLIS
ncbi:MAG: N-acetylmuramoyl-L-alanine amidase [Rickettsiales bacterium]|jgi:N-acetylmuramoyl-L-alanine amidase|nr:N-acetylmuramoyl-L-alanine amidase [Rickettsiales bacterium]